MGDNRPPYMSSENPVCRPNAIVRIGSGTTDSFKKLGKEYVKPISAVTVLI